MGRPVVSALTQRVSIIVVVAGTRPTTFSPSVRMSVAEAAAHVVVVFGAYGPHRTYLDALAAELAVQRPAEVRGHFRLYPSLDEAQLVLALDLVANPHAHAALDAQIHIEADEVRLVVHVELRVSTGNG
jgi:hypothetical protein